MLTVLCIVDDKDLLSFVYQLLSKCGYSVLTAQSLQRGLRVMADNRADAIILDTDLPKIDLEEAFHKIRSCQPQAELVLYGEMKAAPKSVLGLVLGQVHKADLPGLLLLLARAASKQGNNNRDERTIPSRSRFVNSVGRIMKENGRLAPIDITFSDLENTIEVLVKLAHKAGMDVNELLILLDAGLELREILATIAAKGSLQFQRKCFD